GDDYFLEKTDRHQAQARGHVVVIETMVRAVLERQALRALEAARHELGAEHHEERVDAGLPLGLLDAAIHRHDTAHALDRMEGKADGQDDFQRPRGVVPPDESGEMVGVPREESVILEYEEEQPRNDEAHPRNHLPLETMGPLQP